MAASKKKKGGQQAKTNEAVAPQQDSLYSKAEVPLEFATNVNYNEDESWITTFVIQTKALLWKNILVFQRKPSIFLFIIVTPIVVGWLLKLILGIGDSLRAEGRVDYPIYDIDTLPHCLNKVGYREGRDDPCLSIGYSFIGPSEDINDPMYGRYHKLMESVAEQNQFEFGKDVKPLTAGIHHYVDDYLRQKPNSTDYVVVFCHDHWRETIEYVTLKEDIDEADKPIEEREAIQKNKLDWYMPCKFENKDHGEKDMFVYYLVYNVSNSPSNTYTALNQQLEKDNALLRLKLTVDNAILKFKAEEKGVEPIPQIKAKIQDFPLVPNRVFDDIDIISMYGAFYLIMVPLSVFIIIFDELMREKIDNLRRGMELLGTRNDAYWASWIISAFIISLVIAGEMIAIGRYWYGFEVFTRTPMPILFYLIVLTSMAYISMACFFSTLTNTRAQAFSINFSIVLCSLITNVIISDPSMLKKVFFNLDNPQIFRVIGNLFYLNPCFQFAKMFSDITSVACAHFNIDNFTWVKSDKEFEYSDIHRVQEGIFVTKDRYFVVSFYETSLTLYKLMAFYGVLAYYFDSVLSSNRGVPQPWGFPLSIGYWFPFLKSHDREVDHMSPIDPKAKNPKFKTAYEEHNKVFKLEKSQDWNGKDVNGIRAINLSKTYRSDFGGKETHALSNVSFDIGKGELLGIMGHNGAGKSTLINVLCGLVYKDSGNSRVFDHNNDDDLSRIRKRMGVVSQFDVLWDQLTGIEHMQLFQILKRVDISNFESLMKQRLHDVGLQDAGNQQVGKYSGGMRRRISVALSTMGNPNCILMDEPSTGMDPVSRRHVWSLIQRLKLEKSIIMTTHAMEEAELLSDKLIVLDHGEVKCVGTPLQLKNMVGKGYRVSMICDKDSLFYVKNLLKIIIPHGIFQESSGGSGGMVYDLPFSHVKELGSIFNIMDSQKIVSMGGIGQVKKNAKVNPKMSKEDAISELKNLVTDVGVSQTTLEEVFMHVTEANDKKDETEKKNQ